MYMFISNGYNIDHDNRTKFVKTRFEKKNQDMIEFKKKMYLNPIIYGTPSTAKLFNFDIKILD